MGRSQRRACLGILTAAVTAIGLIATPSPGAVAAPHARPGWTAAAAPLPADAGANPGAELEAVACARPRSCVAVGEYLDAHNVFQGLIETRHGAAWRTTTLPRPASAPHTSSITLAGVACPRAGSCVVRGEYLGAHDNTRGLLAVQHGRRWTSVTAPLPAGAATSGQNVDLNTVSCARAGHCVVGGDYVGADGATYGLLEVQSRHGWKARRLPLPANAGTTDPNASVTDVSCRTTRWCVAVGSYMDAKYAEHGLLAVYSGGVWRSKQAPLPANASTTSSPPELRSVQCRKRGSCLVTGDYANSTGRIVPLVETLSHGVWRAKQAPVPADAANANPGAGLSNGACPSARWCAASGTYGITSVRTAGLLEVYSHGVWTRTKAPLPAKMTEPSSELWGLSCPSSRTCMAVGFYQPTGKPHLSQGLIEARVGGRWRATKAPLPANAGARPSVILDSVACSTRRFCVAVGVYYLTTVKSEGLIETWAR